MAQKLALVAAKGRVEGAWNRALGNESSINVTTQPEGCDLVFEFVRPDSESGSIKLIAGSTPFPHPLQRYRIVRNDSNMLPVSVLIQFR